MLQLRLLPRNIALEGLLVHTCVYIYYTRLYDTLRDCFAAPSQSEAALTWMLGLGLGPRFVMTFGHSGMRQISPGRHSVWHVTSSF